LIVVPTTACGSPSLACVSHEIDRLNSAFAGAYRVVGELSGGGMARVFLADDLRLTRRVVIKMLPPDRAGELSTERFAREIALVAGLQQANIVPVLTSGEIDGAAWYVMPYIDGQSLRARLAQAPVGVSEAIRLLRDVARALAFAHARGVIHRDIKPDNILLSGGAAVVTDFGIAKAVDASRVNTTHAITATGTSLGTPAYMAPEQAVGDPVDARADLYAWGMVAYEMLSGRHPFADKTTAQSLIAAHLMDNPPPLRALDETSPALASLVLQCLAKDARSRPESAAELLRAFDAVTTEGAAIIARQPLARRAIVAGVVAVAIAGAWFAHERRASSSAAAERATSVVVLPFDDMTGAADGDVFADGITEDVIARLATIGGLNVISRTSAMVYKKHEKPLKQIAAELNVGAVLEGSVRRSGSRVRVVSKLIDAATDHPLWEQTFDRELADVFTLQSELAERIAVSLKTTLSLPTHAAPPTMHDTLAYQLYLQALASSNELTVASSLRSIALAQQATGRDSTFARAWELMASEYLVLPFEQSSSRDDPVALARAAVGRALALDSNLGEAHSTRARILMLFDHDWKGAEEELRKAVALSPSSQRVLIYYSQLLMTTQRTTEGLAAAEHARALDPLSIDPLVSLGGMLNIARRYDEALALLRRGTELQPDNVIAWATRLNTAVTAARDDDVIESAAGYLRAVKASSPTAAEMQSARAQGGHAALVRFLIDAFPRAELARFKAQWYAELGERDRAVAALENAYQDRVPGLPFILRYKQFDSMRGDPRFVAFVHRLGLEP
jgi:eukaryotic-like serine/threonine-protein kinase